MTSTEGHSATTPSSLVAIDVADRVGVLTMSSPPANALSYELIAQLDEAVTTTLAQGAAVIVFSSGLPKFFAAGADLKLLSTATGNDFNRYLVTLRALIERVGDLPQPTVAAIDGMALGGGLELAMACTIRIGSPRALLGVPEIKLGLLPGAGGTQRLPRLIGRGAALDLLLSGRSIGGQRALDIGLVDHLHPADELIDRTLHLARGLAGGATEAIAAIVRCVDAAADLPFADGMAVEADEVTGLFATEDAREGIAAFIEKRNPDFL